MSMLKKFFILLIILELFLAKEAYSSSTPNSRNELIPLKLKVGILTEVEFPEKIANITKNISSEFLQMETLGSRIFLLPKDNFDARIYVVTEDNLSYGLHIITEAIEVPSSIKIKKPREKLEEEQNKEVQNTVELMKVLLTGQLPPGSVSSKLSNKEIFNNNEFRITADEVYELPQGVKAFVLTFENMINKPVVVPIEHIELPGLLAISVDSQLLEARAPDPKGKHSAYTTKAYLIVEELKQ